MTGVRPAFYKDLFVTSRQLILPDNAHEGSLRYALETKKPKTLHDL